MEIVILDGKTTNPGDLSWAPLEKLGALAVYDSTPPGLVAERAQNAEAVILNRVAMTRELMRRLPKLKFIGTLATGYNTIDTAAADELGITVCNVPLYCVETVAQCAFALLLSLCSHVETFSEPVRQGRWEDAVSMSFRESPIFELSGKTLGILGYGNIGACMARLGQALGMQILVYSRTKRELPKGCRWAGLEELFRESDALSIHCPLTEETRGLVDGRLLSLMKPTAYLINTARGAILNEPDLADALNSGRLAGAGLDVLTEEPPSPDNPLLTARNCILTPHIAWASRDARRRLIETVAENLRQFQNGTPQNVVNPR